MAKRIRVLTFGWEFPPHISGGLGTACYGLTKSLLKQGTDVLFVVPKAHGDEDMALISASDVVVTRVGGEQRIESGQPGSGSKRSVSRLKKMELISVSSKIHPYTTVGTAPVTGLEEWSYVIQASTVGRKRLPGTEREVKYSFSGAYGPNLLQEVARYGEVGAAISRDRDFDLIHAHDWLAFPAGIAARKVSGKPLVIHVHATEYDRAGVRDVDERVLSIEKEGLETSDHIVAVSEWTRKILTTKYGVKDKKIRVIHNGIITRRRRTGGEPSRLGKNMVTFMGRITYQKGPQYFIDAARKVLEKFPDTHFVVAGSGDLLPSIMERVASLKLSSRFHFTGFLRRHQVDEIWSVTDVYVMPSVSEPFGITPLEAIQSGVPVILSNQSGVSEVMPHAIKADFWDIEALAGAICSVLRHKSLARTLKQQSKETLKEITWDTAARKLNELYHEIASKVK